MFKFFTSKDWFLWAWVGGFLILLSTWYQVQLDVKINEWFGKFYDTLQKALSKPGSVSLDEFIGHFTNKKRAFLGLGRKTSQRASKQAVQKSS